VPTGAKRKRVNKLEMRARVTLNTDGRAAEAGIWFLSLRNGNYSLTRVPLTGSDGLIRTGRNGKTLGLNELWVTVRSFIVSYGFEE
jgi:hypothetical protein